MTRLVLVRHGETVWHAENRYAGRSDVALTPRGYEQAERLGEWAATAQLDAIWCSSLTRARETTAPAALATGLEPHVDDRLCELDFGLAEGMTTAEMRERFLERLEAFHAAPVANHLPGGEDPRHAIARAVACLEDIVAAHPGGRVLVVAHTTLIRLTLCHLIGVRIDDYRRVFPFLRNVAITEVRLGEEGTSMLEFNTPLDPDAEAVPGDPPRAGSERAAQ